MDPCPQAQRLDVRRVAFQETGDRGERGRGGAPIEFERGPAERQALETGVEGLRPEEVRAGGPGSTVGRQSSLSLERGPSRCASI